METLGKRIQIALDETKKSRKELASQLGVTTAAIGNLINDEVKKPRTFDIANALGVSKQWLETGEGSMISPFALADGANDELIVIDRLDIHASAGYGAVNGDTMHIISQLRYVPEQYYTLFRGTNPQNLRVINVKGDSMSPTFENGDALFVDISINEFDGDGIYVFTFDNTLFVKRLQKAGRKLRVISDNRTIYPEPWEIEGEELNDVIIHAKVKIHQSQKLNFVG